MSLKYIFLWLIIRKAGQIKTSQTKKNAKLFCFSKSSRLRINDLLQYEKQYQFMSVTIKKLPFVNFENFFFTTCYSASLIFFHRQSPFI